MKYLIFLMLVATGVAHAQILSQRNIAVDGDPGFIERTVQIPDASGLQVIVKQILRPQEDGSLSYIFALQPEETRAYHRAMCESMGSGSPSTGESTWWGPDALAGFACLSEEEKLSAPQGTHDGTWLKSQVSPEEDKPSQSQAETDFIDY